MEVACGEAKFIVEGNHILHVFEDVILHAYDCDKHPVLMDWIEARANRVIEVISKAKPGKWCTFRLASVFCKVEYNKLLDFMICQSYATMHTRPNQLVVIIPSEKALKAGIATQSKKGRHQYLWNRKLIRELINGS